MTLATILVLAAAESENHGNVALETHRLRPDGARDLRVLWRWSRSRTATSPTATPRKAEAYAAAHANDVQRAGHGH